MPTRWLAQEPIADQSVKSLKTLAQVGRSHRQVDAGRGRESKHGLQSFQNPHQSCQGLRIEIRLDLNLPAAGQHDFQGNRSADYSHRGLSWPTPPQPTDYSSLGWPAPNLCLTVLQAPPIEMTLQDAQGHAVTSAECCRPQSALFEFTHQPLDLFTVSSFPVRNSLVCCQLTKKARQWIGGVAELSITHRL